MLLEIWPCGIHRKPNPTMAVLQVRRIGITSSVSTIGYQMPGLAALGIIRTLVKFIMSKTAIRIEVD